MTSEEASIDVAGRQQALADAGITGNGKKRKQRSDAGKPKSATATATLTVQFDLSDDFGRQFFAKTLKFWAENGAVDAVTQIAEQFARKVDAIQKAHRAA